MLSKRLLKDVSGSNINNASILSICRVLKYNISAKKQNGYNKYRYIFPKIKPQYYEKLFAQKRILYYKSTFDINEINKYIFNYGIAFLSYFVYPSYFNKDNEGYLPLPKSKELIIGINNVILTGFNEDEKWFKYFDLYCNHDVSFDGYGYISYDHIPGYINDVKVISSIGYKNIIEWSLEKKYTLNNENLKLIIIMASDNIIIFDLYNNRNKLIGWIIIELIDNNKCKMADFFIWPNKRNKGYGNFLINKSLKYIRSFGIMYIYSIVAVEDLILNDLITYFKKREFVCSYEASEMTKKVRVSKLLF